MPGLLYFVENHAAPAVGREHLAAWGLLHLVDNDKEKPVTCQAVDGPGGKGGHTFAMSGRMGGHKIGFFRDAQEWRRIAEAGPCVLYVGWYRDAPPTPADLERSELLSPVGVTLAGGPAAGKWKVPRLREVIEGDELAYRGCLPSVLKPTADGLGWEGDGVAPEYQALWERGCEAALLMWNAVWGMDDDGESTADTWALENHAVELLTINYTVGRLELWALGLTREENLINVCKASADFETALAGLKKKAAMTGSAPAEPPGGAACGPATGRPGAT